MVRKAGKWAFHVSLPSSILKPKVVNVLSIKSIKSIKKCRVVWYIEYIVSIAVPARFCKWWFSTFLSSNTGSLKVAPLVSKQKKRTSDIRAHNLVSV